MSWQLQERRLRGLSAFVKRSALVTTLAACWGASTPSAHAETRHPASDRAFPYTTSREPNWLRLSLEQLGVIVAGSGYYFSEKNINSLDWEFGYSWSTLERKLVGDGYAFDDNYFNTNFLSHPGSGALYYSSARANHVGVGTSMLVAFASSAVWELLGEFRERVSINDAFVTPLGGFAFGESMVQVGAFFDRSCDSTLHRALGSFFATAKSAHDYFDGVSLARQTQCDAYGLSRVGEHRFRIWSGVAAASDLDSNAGLSSLSAGASSEIINLRAFGVAGNGWTSFRDGNVSSLSASAALSARGTDAHLTARAIPVGYHFRSLRRRGPRGLEGSEWLLGLGAGIDYTVRRYPADLDLVDRLFVLEAPAWLARWRGWSGAGHFELELVVAGALGGATALAQPAYEASHRGRALTSVAQQHSYNHVLGVTASPAARWITPSVEVALEARAERLFGVLGPDADGRWSSEVAVRETRRRAMARVLVGRTRGPRWYTQLGVEARSSSVGEAARRLSELSLSSGLTVEY